MRVGDATRVVLGEEGAVGADGGVGDGSDECIEVQTQARGKRMGGGGGTLRNERGAGWRRKRVAAKTVHSLPSSPSASHSTTPAAPHHRW